MKWSCFSFNLKIPPYCVYFRIGAQVHEVPQSTPEGPTENINHPTLLQFCLVPRLLFLRSLMDAVISPRTIIADILVDQPGIFDRSGGWVEWARKRITAFIEYIINVSERLDHKCSIIVTAEGGTPRRKSRSRGVRSDYGALSETILLFLPWKLNRQFLGNLHAD